METNLLEEYKHCLNYTTCNEDSTSEIKVLNIQKTDVVVSITGSGGRTLNLLTEKPQKIMSVDFNPIQNYLLELKMAAIKNLDYEDYCGFLGLAEMNCRDDVFGTIKDDLSEESHLYWTDNIGLIRQGIIYQGVFEKQRQRTSEFLKKVRPEQIKKMLSFDDLNEQREYYYKVWNDETWKLIISLENSIVNKKSFKDPAFYLFVDDSFDYSKFFHQALEKAFTTSLVNENHFLALVINGGYAEVKKMPRYLDKYYYTILKKNIDKIEIITENIVDFMKRLESDCIDKFSVSDVSSYLGSEEFCFLLEQIIRVGKNHSVLCARNFLVKRDIPYEFTKNIKRNIGLEQELEKKDLSFVYSFIVGEITK